MTVLGFRLAEQVPPAGAFQIENFTHGCHSRDTHTKTHTHTHIKACATTRPTCTPAPTDTHIREKDVLQIVGFMHGCYRSASGGWSRWWRVLWRWPRCSNTNIHSGNLKIKKRGQQPDCCRRHPPPPLDRPRRRDVTGVCVLQNGISTRWLFLGKRIVLPGNFVNM